jgi:hypothetical protein
MSDQDMNDYEYWLEVTHPIIEVEGSEYEADN